MSEGIGFGCRHVSHVSFILSEGTHVKMLQIYMFMFRLISGLFNNEYGVYAVLCTERNRTKSLSLSIRVLNACSSVVWILFLTISI